MTSDPQAATAAYIDSLGADALAKAAAYTAGNHWLLLWGLMVSGLVTWLIVRSGLLERVSAKFARRGPHLRAFAVGVVFFLVSALVTLPWSLYEEWWRERGYGRTSQPLGDFLGQDAIGILISTLLAALFVVGVYALIRRTGQRWWLWSGEVRNALVVMAQESGVPTDRIFVFDGSRQSNNFTANVSGLGGSARIAISDVAFKGASLDEVKAVTGHEIGHYVLGHVWRGVIVISIMSILFFFLADRLFPRFARAFGSRATVADPAGLPVMVYIVSLFAVLAQPVFNTLSRIDETESDRYSLETVNLPDALASALVKTAEYRNPRPNRAEELVFYTHPSVERRVRMAMEWKSKHAAE